MLIASLADSLCSLHAMFSAQGMIKKSRSLPFVLVALLGTGLFYIFAILLVGRWRVGTSGVMGGETPYPDGSRRQGGGHGCRCPSTRERNHWVCDLRQSQPVHGARHAD